MNADKTIHLRVPAKTKARWALASKRAGMTIEDYIAAAVDAYQETPRPRAGRFSPQEKRVALDSFDRGESISDIARNFGRTYNSVRELLRRNDRTIGVRSDIYTDDEDRFIVENYSTLDNTTIAQTLGRTARAIANRAYKLGCNSKRRKAENKKPNRET